MRYYGRYNVPEDVERCVVQIWSGWNQFQCSRKRGKGPDGLFCTQHGKIAEAGNLRAFAVPDDYEEQNP